MPKRGGGLQDVKGGGLLSTLLARLAPPSPPPPPPAPDPDAVLQAATMRRTRPPLAPTKAAVARGQAKPKVTRIKLPRAVADAVRATWQAPGPRGAAVPIALPDAGQAAFARMQGLGRQLDGFIADHAAPERVSGDTAAQVERLVELGATALPGQIDPDDGFFLGYDFGTSTTKAVLRHPYRFGSAFALDVPGELASGGTPHLWPSVVWLDAGGRFHLCPAPDRVALAGFKAALIGGEGHRTYAGGVRKDQAATAFVALHLAYLCGALRDHDATARLAGVNVAVPVASLTLDRSRASFERVVQAALRLVPAAATLTLARVEAALAADTDPLLPAELHAELSGAIAGYCRQPRRSAGAHMIVDCGSATLDMASFRLSEAPWPIGIHAAAVERLGADACALFRREGASLDECRAAGRFQEHQVYRDTLGQARASFVQDGDRRYPYQVILTGGGMAGEVHGPLFDRMQAAFGPRFHRPGVAADLRCDPAADQGRLIIADGLACDPIDLREVRMPVDRPQPLSGDGPEMITKDQV